MKKRVQLTAASQWGGGTRPHNVKLMRSAKKRGGVILHYVLNSLTEEEGVVVQAKNGNMTLHVLALAKA